jgi:hypothetical protein
VSSSKLGTHADISSNQEWVLGVGVLQSFKRSDFAHCGGCVQLGHPTLTMGLKRNRFELRFLQSSWVSNVIYIL